MTRETHLANLIFATFWENLVLQAIYIF